MFGVYYDAPDAGAGAGSEPTMAADPGGDALMADDPSSGDDDPGVDAGAADDAADPADEDVLFDGDDDSTALPLDEQLKRLRKAHRRLKKKHLQARTERATLEAEAQQYREIREAMRQNPRLRALIYGSSEALDREPKRSEPAPVALPTLPDEFTPETLGFDPSESVANRVLANTVQTVAALAREIQQLRRLQPTVETLNRSWTQQQQATEEREWKSAADRLEVEAKKAAGNNPLLSVTLRAVKDAMWGARLTRHIHKATPQQIVDSYLAELVKSGAITRKQAGQVSAATQSRMATHNRTLPRSPAGGGQPSTARGNQRLLLKDVHAKLRAGMIGPR